MGRRNTEHPALALMRREAQGFMSRFQTDLEVHDARLLEQAPPGDAFAWVLHTHATYLTFADVAPRKHRFATMFVEAYGARDSRFFFWTGAVLVRCASAAALDTMLGEHEDSLRGKNGVA